MRRDRRAVFGLYLYFLAVGSNMIAAKVGEGWDSEAGSWQLGRAGLFSRLLVE
jgi:hypothetical protein